MTNNYDFIYNYLASRADKKILARGRDVYAEGSVKKLIETDDGEFEAEVLGSELYDVFITVKDGVVEDFGCDCPYDWGDVCKHLIAVALAIQNDEHTQALPGLDEQKLYELLLNIDPDELLDFLAEYAVHEPKFENALRVRFAQPEFDTELKKIKRSIGNALADLSDWDTHDRWGYASVDTSEIQFEIEQRVKQGHIKLAFAALEALFCGLLENFEYQSECELAEEAEDCLRRMADIAEIADKADDQEYIFERCIALASFPCGKDYGADYEDRLLAIAAKFVTEENRGQLEEALALHEQGYSAGAFALIHLDVIERLDGGAAARAYIKAHLDVAVICDIAVSDALALEDYARAVTLCENFIQENDKGYHYCKNWYARLFSIHEKTGDTEKQIALARKLLLEKQDYNYYATLKKLLKQRGDWKNEYPSLREQCAAFLPSNLYMQLLLEEKEAALLLEEVRKRQNTIYTYGAFLAKTYPDETYCIFWDEIKTLADKASSRSMYHEVCGKIKLLADAGGIEDAEALIGLLRQRNPRRPAFLDELGKLEARMAREKK